MGHSNYRLFESKACGLRWQVEVQQVNLLTESQLFDQCRYLHKLRDVIRHPVERCIKPGEPAIAGDLQNLPRGGRWSKPGQDHLDIGVLQSSGKIQRVTPDTTDSIDIMLMRFMMAKNQLL